MTQSPTKPDAAERRPWYKKLFRRGTVIPVVRLQGVLSQDQRPGRLNIASVGPLLEKAFAHKKAPVVAIVVSSPGGSAVQSRLIAERIRQLAGENGKTVLVFVEDAAASGGYFIALGGDEIIADPCSLVGSIGVIFAGFGFVEAIAKLGITRRVHTAGKSKSMLDPFLPEKKDDVDRIKQMETEIHEVFMDYVKTRRAGRLKAGDDVLFTGAFWTAMRGIDLGLVDALGTLHETLRARYGAEVRLKFIAPKRGLFQLPGLGFGGRAGGATIASEALVAIEDRVLWSRLGL